MRILRYIIIVIFITALVYAEEAPPKPKNLPSAAAWQGKARGWEWIDAKAGFLHSWYSNGVPKQKVPMKKGQIHGVWEFWGRDGVKIMNKIYDHGKVIKIINYKIYHPDFQRPLNIPKDAIWNKPTQLWISTNKKTFLRRIWYMNGEKMAQAKYINGKLEGKVLRWYINGKMREKLYSKNGSSEGRVTKWMENGKLNTIEYFRDRKLVWTHDYNKKPPENLPKGVVWHVQYNGWSYVKDNKEYILFSNGKIKIKIELKGDDYHGKVIGNYKKGSIDVKGQFRNSKKEGVWSFYKSDGTKEMEVTYKKNKIIKKKRFDKK